jgi:hypothetical protein
MPRTHTRSFRVRHYECDARGRVHHANYLLPDAYLGDLAPNIGTRAR